MSNTPKMGQELTVNFEGREQAAEVLAVEATTMVVRLTDGRNVTLPLHTQKGKRERASDATTMKRERGS